MLHPSIHIARSFVHCDHASKKRRPIFNHYHRVLTLIFSQYACTPSQHTHTHMYMHTHVHAHAHTHIQFKASGDAISDLMAMNKAYPLAPSKTKNIHQMITSLATASAHHGGHHSQSAALLRPSVADPSRISHSSIRAESAL